jgi:integrase
MNVVDAVNKEQIALVYTILNKEFGEIYGDIWKVGLNISLRISDLLNLRYTDFDLANRELSLRKSKIDKAKSIRLNQTVIDIITKRNKEYPNDVWLFQVHSSRAKDKPISRAAVRRRLKTQAICSISTSIPIPCVNHGVWRCLMMELPSKK